MNGRGSEHMGEKMEIGSCSVLRTCPVCGKKFIPNVQWAYKRSNAYYCRYNCYRQAGGDGGGKDRRYTRQRVENKRKGVFA